MFLFVQKQSTCYSFFFDNMKPVISFVLESTKHAIIFALKHETREPVCFENDEACYHFCVEGMNPVRNIFVFKD